MDHRTVPLGRRWSLTLLSSNCPSVSSRKWTVLMGLARLGLSIGDNDFVIAIYLLITFCDS
jgi:hypothetical protein